MFSRIIALVLLFLFSPLFLISAIIIFIEDGLPVFFLQQRIGMNKIPFSIYKFRTMKIGTPNLAKHLLHNTELFHLRSGTFFRLFSIDELPNLINIIKGQMNFIGPRPALYNEYELIEMRDKAGIYSLKPGLTGWAQVNGRDFLSNLEKVKFEKEYLVKQSILFNLKILLMTFAAVIKPILFKCRIRLMSYHLYLFINILFYVLISN